MIALDTADGAMELYEAVPEGTPRGAVIVIQEAFGVNDHMQDVTRRCAAAGYHAVAPALFHRCRRRHCALRRLRPGHAALCRCDRRRNPRRRRRDIAYLEGVGFAPARIGIVGFCFGGRVTFLVAARRALGAAVGFYGGGIAAAGGLPFPPLIEESATLQTPWLGLFGDLDGGISIESVEALRTALETAPVDAAVVRYPDAEHGFHCDARASYHAESAADGWRRTLEWFDTHLA